MAGAQREFLWDTKLNELVKTKPALVWVEPTTPITEVCTQLRLHNYLSLPVFDKEVNSWVGIANIADIAMFIVWGSSDIKQKEQDEQAARGMPSHPSELELVPRLKFAGRPIGDVLISDEARNFIIFDGGDSVYSVLEPLSKGYHRALVRLKPDSSRPEDFRLLTQTDVVRFLFRNKNSLDQSLLATTVQDGGLVEGRQHMLCVTDENLTVMQAFRRMTQRDMSCIGICDPRTGRLIFNLSASDLRGITPDALNLLLLSVNDYLTAMYGETLCHKMYPVTCAPDALIGSVIESMLAHKVHRVWVVDATDQPVGIISLSDIITKFSPYDYKALAQSDQ